MRKYLIVGMAAMLLASAALVPAGAQVPSDVARVTVTPSSMGAWVETTRTTGVGVIAADPQGGPWAGEMRLSG